MAAEQFTVATRFLKKPWQCVNCASVIADTIVSGVLTLPSVEADDGEYILSSANNILSLVPTNGGYMSAYLNENNGGFIGKSWLYLGNQNASLFQTDPNDYSRIIYFGTSPRAFLCTLSISMSWTQNAGPGAQSCRFAIESSNVPAFQPGIVNFNSPSAYSIIESNTIVLRAFGLIFPGDVIRASMEPLLGVGPKIAGMPTNTASMITIVSLT